MADGCIGPINIIPDNNEVVLQNVNQTITVVDNNCCTTVDVVQPTTEVIQILTGPLGRFPTEGPYGFTGSFDISGSLTVTGSIYGDTIYSPYFTGSFYGNGTGIFSGSFSGSISANLQDVTNNGNVTTLPITASSYYGNGLQIVGDATITGSLTVSGSNTFRNIGPAQFTGSTDISGSLSINGVDYEFTSASFDQRILNNSASISYLSSSYLQDSASFDIRVLNNSASISLLSGSYLTDSGSFSTRITDLENFSSSLDATFATDAELNAATASLSASIAYLSGSYLFDSASFDVRILDNSASISLLSGSFLNTSGSLSIRVTDLENFSSSLDATFATDAELNAATASLSSSIAYLSGSYLLDSASFDTRILNNSSSISYLSSSYLISSASFDSRINSIITESLGPGVIAVDVATSASLRSSTYYNGISNDGIGATLTSTANGALGTIDGVTTLLNWRILVKNQVTQLQNGIYELIQTGSSVAPFILTRTIDADETSEFSPQVVIPTKGVLNKSINFSQITEDPSIGVNNIIYQQLSGSNNYLSQQTVGTQAVNQIPIYTSVGKELTRGSSTFTYTVSTGQFRIRNIPYVYPSTQGANGTVLMNNGSGTLRWANNFTGSFSGSFTGSLAGTSSWASNALTASYVQNAQTASYVLNAVSSSFASTASYLNTLNQDLTFNGNLILNGTASIAFLNVAYESASVIYSSGSNQLGDATDDTQLLIGAVKISGSLEVTGSANIPSLTGSLFGTASFAETSSNILGGKATHVPFFITDTSLATSSIYQSGSSTVVINQDSATTANPEALYVWQPSTSSFNVISGKGNLNNYLQLNIQNTNQGINASSDVVATANNGSENDNYIDMGINSENYTGFLGGPNDAYLYAHSNNLWIGNVNDGYKVYFFNSSSEQPIITLNSDNAEVTGSLYGTASWAENAVTASNAITASYALNADLLDGKDSSIFATTGSNTFIGNQTVTGSLNVSGSTFQIGNNTLLGTTTLSGSIIISGSANANANITLQGYLRLDPGLDPGPSNTTSSYLFTSASNTLTGFDLYYRQNGNLVKYKWLEGMLNTGVLFGGVLSYSSSYFYLTSGSGIIVNHNAVTSSEISPTITYVNWSAITQSIIDTGSQNTYVYIDANGNLQQQSTFFTAEQYHEYLPIGRVSHYGTNSSIVTGVGNNMVTAYDQSTQLGEFVRAFGPLKVSGLTITPQPGTLHINIGSGTSFNLGGFYQYDPDLPSVYNSPTYLTSSIIRIYRSGSGFNFDNNAGTYYTTVDPTKWDNGSGILQNVGNNNWSIQRVFVNPISGRSHIYYGQTTYATYLDAIGAVSTDDFEESDVTKNAYVFTGYLVVEGGAGNTDLSVSGSTNAIIQSGLFRNSVGGSGGAGAAAINLNDLSDVDITTPSNGQALIYNSGLWINGTPTNATSASHATTSSYSETALSSSYALTASYAVNAGSGGFPYTGSAIITGSLVITGSTTSTEGFTGSLFGTASWASNSVSASYALSSSYAVTASHALVADSVLGSVTSASYAATASMGVNFAVQNTLTLNGTLTDSATVLSTIVGSNNLFTQATGSRTSAFGKYTIFNGANARAGEFITVWNGTTVTYTDVSTTDIGNTSTITFNSVIVGGDIQINAIAGASGWTIKMLTTYI